MTDPQNWYTHLENIRANLTLVLSADAFAAVVGKPIKGEDKPITGPSGDHLQFYLDAGVAGRFQVDVNTRSRDGSAVQVFVATEQGPPPGLEIGTEAGLPAPGLFTDAALDYRAMGLVESDFTPMSYYRIDALLNAALGKADLVSAYGMTFDDGGPNGKGIHDIHMDTAEGTSQDGALAIYTTDGDGREARLTWYFFKFNDQTLPAPSGS